LFHFVAVANASAPKTTIVRTIAKSKTDATGFFLSKASVFNIQLNKLAPEQTSTPPNLAERVAHGSELGSRKAMSIPIATAAHAKVRTRIQ
jgi:hypothetical protein